MHPAAHELSLEQKAVVAAASGPLRTHLLWWVYDLTPHDHRTRYHKPVAWLRSSKVSITLTLLTLAQLLSDVILTRKIYGMPGRFAAGTFSCITAQFTYRNRWHQLRDVYVRAIQICTELESDADAELQARFHKLAKFCVRCRTVFRSFAWSNLVITMWNAYKAPEWHLVVANALIWAFGVTQPEAQRRITLGVQIGTVPVKWCVSVSLNTAFYTIIACLIIMPRVLALCYQAIAVKAELEPFSLRWPRLQSVVLDAAMKMEETVFPVLPGILVMAFVMPLLCTVEIILLGSEADLFSLLTASHILTVFVPICFAGDLVIRSREAMSVAVYNGSWVQETPSQRRVRLYMMHAAFGVGGRLRGIVGTLDRPACGSALKSWFSFVQFFSGLQDVQNRN